MSTVDLARAAFALIAVLGLIALAALAGRRLRAGDDGTRRLRLVETLALDAKRRLVVVRWGAREHLMAIGPDTFSLVAAEAPAAKPPSAEANDPADAPVEADAAPPPAGLLSDELLLHRGDAARARAARKAEALRADDDRLRATPLDA
ncbi:MAG: flagellar biosynthetic protein FliO [Parvularculaceae bacterium]